MVKKRREALLSKPLFIKDLIHGANTHKQELSNIGKEKFIKTEIFHGLFRLHAKIIMH